MSVILLILGIVIAATGIATVGFGIPINEFSLGTTLIVAGTTALTGGLILIGLSAVVNELGRVAEGLRARVVPRPAPRSAEAPEPVVAAPIPPSAVDIRAMQAPVPTKPRPEAPGPGAYPAEPNLAKGTSSVEVSAAAIERLRSTIPRAERPRAEPSVVADAAEVPLSPNGGADQPARQSTDPNPVLPEPKVTSEDRAGGAAVEALKASRLDFLFRSKVARSAPQPESFDTFWPADARSGRSADAQTQLRSAQTEQGSNGGAPVEEQLPEPPSREPARAPAILKSGIVDGMAYTLYADGSIEAKLPQGTVKFGSIAELRAHIETSS